MDDLLDEIEQTEKFTDQEIFTKIWTRPRAVLKFINEFKYDKFLYPLLAVIGITNSLDRAVERGLGHTFGLPSILFICLFLGGLLGWISYYIGAALISWTGKALDGEANTWTIFRVTAYASIPAIIVLILYTIQIICWGHDVFKINSDYSIGFISHDVMFLVIAILELGLGIYGLVLTIIGISEVQKFGIGKAILNVLLVVALVMIPILLIYVLSM